MSVFSLSRLYRINQTISKVSYSPFTDNVVLLLQEMGIVHKSLPTSPMLDRYKTASLPQWFETRRWAEGPAKPK